MRGKKIVRLKYFPIGGTEATQSEPDYVLFFSGQADDKKYFKKNTIKPFPDALSPQSLSCCSNPVVQGNGSVSRYCGLYLIGWIRLVQRSH